MMRPIVFILLLLTCTYSCKKNSDPALVGKWQLTETLVDPGNGSGTFQDVSSDKTIKFKSNGTFTSNGSICDLNTDANDATSGEYSNSEHTVTPTGCGSSSTVLNYEIINGDLILHYPCFEACQVKYEKVN